LKLHFPPGSGAFFYLSTIPDNFGQAGDNPSREKPSARKFPRQTKWNGACTRKFRIQKKIASTSEQRKEFNMGWIYKLVLTVSLFIVAAPALADGGDYLMPETVNIPLSKAYVPIGFDSNDRIQVTVEGSFESTCYKIGPYNVHLDESNKTIRVQQTAYKYFGPCMFLQVPFVQTMDLGLLGEGGWKLVDAKTERDLGSVPVELAKTQAPDEFLYAPVLEAYVFKDPGTFKNSLALSGTFTDRCTVLKEVRIHYYPEVVVVQPIAEQISGRDCGPQLTRFTHTVALQEGLHGAFLLHVRSMNGQAVNKVVDLR